LGSGAEGREAIVILGATDMSAPATYSIDASKADLFQQKTDSRHRQAGNDTASAEH